MENDNIYIKELDKKIITFLKKHHVMTLATAENNIPWCCTCFYVFDEKTIKFFVTSDHKTRHVKEVLMQPMVSGVVALETTMVGKIQGIQFSGIMNELGEDEYSNTRKIYIKRFPVASLVKLQLWSIIPDFIKFTDNRLGFGKKMIWQRKS